MRIGKFERAVLGALSLLSYSQRGYHPLRWVKYRDLVRFINVEVVESAYGDGRPIPRAVSARISQTARRLEEKGSIRLERTRRGQVARVHLTPGGLFALEGRGVFAGHLDQLRSYYPAAKEMAEAVGLSASQLSRWTNGVSYPDDLAGVTKRLQDLLEDNGVAWGDAMWNALTSRPRS